MLQLYIHLEITHAHYVGRIYHITSLLFSLLGSMLHQFVRNVAARRRDRYTLNQLVSYL